MKNNILPIALIITSFCLAGCSTFNVGSLATLVVTGKGLGDHTLSVVTGQDCHFFNIIQKERICIMDNSAEMLLLTSEQEIDDSLKVERLNNHLVNNTYLVIGSFSDQVFAESCQTEYMHWNSQVILSDTKYRVVIGPVSQQDEEHLKKSLINEGVESPWLLTL